MKFVNLFSSVICQDILFLQLQIFILQWYEILPSSYLLILIKGLKINVNQCEMLSRFLPYQVWNPLCYRQVTQVDPFFGYFWEISLRNVVVLLLKQQRHPNISLKNMNWCVHLVKHDVEYDRNKFTCWFSLNCSFYSITISAIKSTSGVHKILKY